MPSYVDKRKPTEELDVFGLHRMAAIIETESFCLWFIGEESRRAP